MRDVRRAITAVLCAGGLLCGLAPIITAQDDGTPERCRIEAIRVRVKRPRKAPCDLGSAVVLVAHYVRRDGKLIDVEACADHVDPPTWGGPRAYRLSPDGYRAMLGDVWLGEDLYLSAAVAQGDRVLMWERRLTYGER